MVKNTQQSHLDYVNLVNAYSMMTRLSEWIQNGLEEASNLAKVLNVERRLEVLDTKTQAKTMELLNNFTVDLNGGRRKFVKEGEAMVIRSKDRKHKKYRYLFLFSDMILVSKSHAKEKYHIKNVFKFDKTCKLEYGTEFFQIVLTIKGEKIYFNFASQFDCDEWSRAMSQIVDAVVHRDEKVLGIPLIELMNRQNETQKIPSFIETIRNLFSQKSKKKINSSLSFQHF